VGTPPQWLTSAVEAVLADFQHPSPIPLKVSYAALGGDDCWTVVIEEVGGRSRSFEADAEDRDAGLHLHERLAWDLQQYLLLETLTAWGEGRPPCPGHSHPASPSTTGEALWICPRDGRAVGRIGQLA
jgi:hypothetical protein